MSYIDPSKVNSPKHSWGQNHTVLIDTGSGGWSAAEGTWEVEPYLALRWNERDGHESIENPQSRGNSTWWIVPDELSGALRREIALIKKSKGLVTCNITKPKEFSSGAWRIEAKLGTQVKDLLKNSPLIFNYPQMETRRINFESVKQQKYCHDFIKGEGVFIDGIWSGLLYSNGIAEDDNPITIDSYSGAFIQEVIDTIARSKIMA